MHPPASARTLAEVPGLIPIPQQSYAAASPEFEARVLATRINELIARLGSVIGAHKRFVADAAHQLRTPLAAVLLHAERAERAADPQAARLALRELHAAVDRAARLIQQLLTLASTEPEAAAAATDLDAGDEEDAE